MLSIKKLNSQNSSPEKLKKLGYVYMSIRLVSNRLENIVDWTELTSSSLMYHVILAKGFEGPNRQDMFTKSPIL